MARLLKSLVLAAAAAHLAVLPLTYASPSYALTGDVVLPSPYVSRALDAVLLPIDSTVRSTFALGPKEEGVLVLAVQPGGVADSQGIEAGDVISQIRGRHIVDPIELDEIVYFWITQGMFDFGFDYYRAGVLATASALITLELYEEVIDIATVASWESWSVETSFSYAEFYEEYSEEITTSYESAETTIEETVSSEEFSEEALSAEISDDTGDSDGDGVADAEDSDDDGDGVDDASDTDDDGDGVDDADDTEDAASDDSEDDSGDDASDDSGDDAGDDTGDDSGEDAGEDD